MQILRLFVALLLLTGFFFVPPQKVWACSPARISMEHALESAESIFVGRVVALEEIPNPTQDFVLLVFCR